MAAVICATVFIVTYQQSVTDIFRSVDHCGKSPVEKKSPTLNLCRLITQITQPASQHDADKGFQCSEELILSTEVSWFSMLLHNSFANVLKDKIFILKVLSNLI